MTCVACKLLEHIVCSKLMAHLDEHKLMSDNQLVFGKWYSYETHLTMVINDWAKMQDNKGQVDTFTLDIEKAIHLVHEIVKNLNLYTRQPVMLSLEI